MGFGGISPMQLFFIFLIVVMLFGTKKLRNIGADLGGALKGFKKSMKDDDSSSEKEDETQDQITEQDGDAGGATIDVKAEKVDDK